MIPIWQRKLQRILQRILERRGNAIRLKKRGGYGSGGGLIVLILVLQTLSRLHALLPLCSCQVRQWSALFAKLSSFVSRLGCHRSKRPLCVAFLSAVMITILLRELHKLIV